MWVQGSCRMGGLGTSARLEVLFCSLDTEETDLEEVRPQDPESSPCTQDTPGLGSLLFGLDQALRPL